MLFNTTVSDVSPLLFYIPKLLWVEASNDDPFLINYADGSYHSTNSTLGTGTVSFSWNGTGIWLYGGWRERLGPYQVVLDGNSSDYPGFEPGDNESGQAILFGATGLQDDRAHRIEITNVGGESRTSILDFDHLVFESQSSGQPTIVNTDSPQFHWLSADNQTVWNDNSSTYTTVTPGGSVQFDFSGDALSIYGSVGGNTSSYIVTTDNQRPQSLNSNTEKNGTLQLLYFLNGLAPDRNHTVSLQNNPVSDNGNSGIFSINYAEVYYTDSSNLTSTLKNQTESRKRTVILSSTSAAAVMFVITLILTRVYQKRQAQHARQVRAYIPRPFPKDVPTATMGSRVTERVVVVGDPPQEPLLETGRPSRHIQSPHYDAPFQVPPLLSQSRSEHLHALSSSTLVHLPAPSQTYDPVTTRSRSPLPVRQGHESVDISPSNIPPPPYHVMSL